MNSSRVKQGEECTTWNWPVKGQASQDLARAPGPSGWRAGRAEWPGSRVGGLGRVARGCGPVPRSLAPLPGGPRGAALALQAPRLTMAQPRIRPISGRGRWRPACRRGGRSTGPGGSGGPLDWKTHRWSGRACPERRTDRAPGRRRSRCPSVGMRGPSGEDLGGTTPWAMVEGGARSPDWATSPSRGSAIERCPGRAWGR
jgi:hypothetical protein